MNQPLGRSGSGIDTQDAHAVIRAYGAECAREAHHSRVGNRPDDDFGIRPFAAIADDVDDNAAATCAHRQINFTGKVHCRDDLETETLAPIGVGDAFDWPRGSCADIVHQNVDVAAGLGQRHHVAEFLQVAGMRHHRHLIARSQRVGRALEILRRSCRKVQRAAGGPKRFGRRTSDAARTARHQDCLASQTEVQKMLHPRRIGRRNRNLVYNFVASAMWACERIPTDHREHAAQPLVKIIALDMLLACRW